MKRKKKITRANGKQMSSSGVCPDCKELTLTIANNHEWRDISDKHGNTIRVIVNACSCGGIISMPKISEKQIKAKLRID